jgi:arylsulfatase A-like enzyme
MLTRRQLLQTFGSVAVPAALAQQSQARPNIVFLFTDDHAFQAISAYNHPLRLNQTPNIDRIAKEGMLFQRCLVPNSICAPARATILTGKYSHKNGISDNSHKFDGSQTTFPKLLRESGYQTALFGKWHLQSNPTGFDAWEVLPGQGSYYNPDFITEKGAIRKPGYATDLITDRGLEWLDARDKTKPFCLMLQHKAPHRNWMPAARHFDLYETTVFPEPETLFDDYKGRATPATKQAMEIDRHMTLFSDLKVPEGDSWDALPEYKRMSPEQKAGWSKAYQRRKDEFRRLQPKGKDLVKWKYQQYMKDYLRCIAAVDENVGRVLDHLGKNGLADNTLVVYASDQGFYLGEHGWFDKRWIYEESVRTPCMARWPGKIKPGSSSDAMVSNLDFAQTFLEAAGVSAPSEMQGRSLLPVFKSGGKPGNWRKSFYYRYTEPQVHDVAPHEGVITSRYKLAYFWETKEWEMYDRQKDPKELRSIADDPAYFRLRRELERELQRLREVTGAPVNGSGV